MANSEIKIKQFYFTQFRIFIPSLSHRRLHFALHSVFSIIKDNAEMGQTTSVHDLTHIRSVDLSCHAGIFSDQQQDYISEIPEECLALIFKLLRSGDRKRCSSVCRRWLTVEGQSRHRLALNASKEIAVDLPSIFTRFNSITKLALRCDRKSCSLNDDALALISLSCSELTHLKIRRCCEISDLGMLAIAQNCKSLRKFSCGFCNFGAKGLNALLHNCSSLEELSVKRLRGINYGFAVESIGPGIAASSLKSITLRELYNGRCFGPLIAGSKNLKTLKIIRCLEDWDGFLETIVGKKSCLTEIHLERLQVSDVGLMSISKCNSLEVFHLVKAPDCSDNGILAIAEKCKLLRKIYIDGWRTNRIGDEGLIGIAQNSINLIELVLIGVNPTLVSLMAIATNCKTLERLALCGGETIGDSEISSIASKCTTLKKLCIKGCRVTDSGSKAFAFDCPNLVKLKIKKCKGVSNEAADWLRERRAFLNVNLDTQDSNVTCAPISGSGVNVFGCNVDTPSSSNGAEPSSKLQLNVFAGRTLAACAFQSSPNDNSYKPE